MFRLHKQKSDRPGGRYDFKFSGFHALKAPKGWDKLSLYFTSVETGKTISKLGKASVRNGECRWTETLSESLWVAQDGKESLYKFIISLGSTRSGILGEATINLAEHTSSKVSSNLLLPLENCSFGTSLEVYTVIEGYDKIKKKKDRVGWWRLVWDSKVRPRAGFICWLALKGRLRTRSWLVRHGLYDDDQCVLCGKGQDDMKHLFFECEYSYQVADLVSQGLKLKQKVRKLEEWWPWMMKVAMGEDRNGKKETMCCC